MFSNGKWYKNVKTVGQLIHELSLIDPKLPVRKGSSDSIDVVVINRNRPDIYVDFTHGGDWDEIE